jgi:hypothetical protein
MNVPSTAPAPIALKATAPPCPPQMSLEHAAARTPPKIAPPAAPTESPIKVLRLRRAFDLTETRVTCCGSIDRAFTVNELSVTLSNLPVTA